MLLAIGYELAPTCSLLPKVEDHAIHDRTTPLRSLHGVVLGQNDTGNALMGKFGVAFRLYCKSNRQEILNVTWNMHLIGRGENDPKQYPELDSNVKAMHTKVILFFLATIAAELFQDHCSCNLD